MSFRRVEVQWNTIMEPGAQSAQSMTLPTSPAACRDSIAKVADGQANDRVVLLPAQAALLPGDVEQWFAVLRLRVNAH